MNEKQITQKLRNAIRNNGIIATTQLVECMAGMIDAGQRNAWRNVFKMTLSRVGATHCDPIFDIKVLSNTHCQITELRDPDTYRTVFTAR